MKSQKLKAFLVFNNSWAFLESRRLVQVIPEHVRKLWNNWEIRVLVLVSLTLQLCLLHFGSRRRYSSKTWLSVFLWLSYLGADSVATVALGVISSNHGNFNDFQLQNELVAFWAPFMLLHLGGQDTITAYAVQDNELWLRHLLGLVVQSVVSVYIILLSWKVSWLSFLSIPLFLAGFIKYAERTWVLKSANNDISFRDNRYLSLEDCIEDIAADHEPTSRNVKIGIFRFFLIVRRLFLNQKARTFTRYQNYFYFSDSRTAWNMIEGELGYAYDVYYTKAPLFFTARGFIIRTFSFTSILFVFVLFLTIECRKHPFVDLIVTYLLLVGAIFMEIYGVVLLCASEWPFQRSGNGLFDICIEALLTPLRSGSAKWTGKQRWSNSMCQLDLLGLCLNDKSLQGGDGTRSLSSSFRGWAMNKVLLKLNGELEMLSYMTHKQVSAELKDYVFRSFLPERGWNSNGFPEKYNKYITSGTESIETYQSIIIWHIATDLCFYTDDGTDVSNLWLQMSQAANSGGNQSNLCQAVCKDLSDYMMYIVSMLPLVLSAGNAKSSFVECCRDVRYYIKVGNLSKLSKVQVCEGLISLSFSSDELVYYDLSGDHLFRLGVLLAQKLKRTLGMWKTLSSFWCDILVYVATVCQVNNHAQLLRNGGEFLTHVWLLEEHFKLVRGRRDAGIAEEAAVGSVAGDDAAVVEEEAVVSSDVGDDESAL